MNDKPKMTKAEAGRLGGLRTFALYGHDHMVAIGKQGYKAVKHRYMLMPDGISGWMLVSKETGRIVTRWK